MKEVYRMCEQQVSPPEGWVIHHRHSEGHTHTLPQMVPLHNILPVL